MEIVEIDMINIDHFAKKLVDLTEYRVSLGKYLHDKMNIVAPNLSALIGDSVGARLISQAGSLTNLAKFPASTVQILGAEKALFRALKTKSKTPKYGLIFHSTFIGKAGARNKGRISRYLANKCSIASRLDSFSEAPDSSFGDALRKQVEQRLDFLDGGPTPPSNQEVMNRVLEQIKPSVISNKETEPKKRKSSEDLLEKSKSKEKATKKVSDIIPNKDKSKKENKEESKIVQEKPIQKTEKKSSLKDKKKSKDIEDENSSKRKKSSK